MKRRLPVTVLAILLLCLLPEMVLSGADWGLWGKAHLRSLAIAYGGFWPGLLHNWQPNYALQPVLMFGSYGFLHGGLLHLTVNIATLLSLGPAIVARVGGVRFLAIYTVSLIAGAAAFALLSASPAPMVGASGALFGLAGAILAWEYRDRVRLAEDQMPVLTTIAGLAFLNLALWWAMGGQLAWQAHLGGFLAGWAYAWLTDSRVT